MLPSNAKIYLRAKGNLDYGWRHVLRTLTLKKHLKAYYTYDIYIGIEGDSGVNNFTDSQSLNVKKYEFDDYYEKEFNFLEKLTPDLIIVDVLKATKKQLELYQNFTDKLVIFNDLGFDYKIGDIIIMPQVLENYPQQRKNQLQLIGPEYFILSNNITKFAKQKKIINNEVNKILVMMGGCIKESIFKKVIDVFKIFKNK